jgi:hypothetical protein
MESTFKVCPSLPIPEKGERSRVPMNPTPESDRPTFDNGLNLNSPPPSPSPVFLYLVGSTPNDKPCPTSGDQTASQQPRARAKAHKCFTGQKRLIQVVQRPPIRERSTVPNTRIVVLGCLGSKPSPLDEPKPGGLR